MKHLLLILLICSGCATQKYSYENSEYKIYRNLRTALKNKSDVKVLVLANKQMKEFPIEIMELSNLKILNLTRNQITEIPKEIKKLKKLERLDLMMNKLEGLPIEIAELKKLKRVNVSYNSLRNEDVKFIKESLPECFVITHVKL